MKRKLRYTDKEEREMISSGMNNINSSRLILLKRESKPKRSFTLDYRSTLGNTITLEIGDIMENDKLARIRDIARYLRC